MCSNYSRYPSDRCHGIVDDQYCHSVAPGNSLVRDELSRNVKYLCPSCFQRFLGFADREGLTGHSHRRLECLHRPICASDNWEHEYDYLFGFASLVGRYRCDENDLDIQEWLTDCCKYPIYIHITKSGKYYALNHRTAERVFLALRRPRKRRLMGQNIVIPHDLRDETIDITDAWLTETGYDLAGRDNELIYGFLEMLAEETCYANAIQLLRFDMAYPSGANRLVSRFRKKSATTKLDGKLLLRLFEEVFEVDFEK